MDQNEKLLLDYMHDTIYNPEKARLEVEKLPEGYKELGKGIQYFASCIQETSELAKELSKGNLNNISLPPPENEIAAPLKAVHAKMKHIVWQANQVSQGDYQQRIDYMGEFSEAFNNMTEELRNQRGELLEAMEGSFRKTEALEQSTSLLEAITSKMSQWIIVVGVEDHEWLYTNHRADEVLINPANKGELFHWIELQVGVLKELPQPYVTELELQYNSRVQYFSVEVHSSSWYEDDACIFIFTDISSEKEEMLGIQHTAYTDILTKLYSRYYGMKVLNEWLDEKKEFILCFVDIDNLKYVNDRFGHDEGDRYIIGVADTLRTFSPKSVISRIGGDEFMILAKDLNGDEATKQMEALKTKLLAINNDLCLPYYSSISYGVVEIKGDNTLSASDLLSNADEKMYEYKRECKMRRRDDRAKDNMT